MKGAKMEREQIIKALECCSGNDCRGCPYFGHIPCTKPMNGDALALIKELTEEIESLRKRIQHLCASEFIASFDEVDINTKAYKKDITEADHIFKEYQRLEALYDPFHFCSMSGCEGMSKNCFKTCPDGYVNSIKIKVVKEMQEAVKTTLKEQYGTLPHTTYFHKAVDKTAKKMLEGIEGIDNDS
jgi:hypothetical protein